MGKVSGESRVTRSRGPGRPPEAKGPQTRERILRAAREVFSEFGYEAATLQSIAARADLTRPAINHYFGSKNALYLDVLEQTNNKVVAAGIERAREKTTLLEQISAFFETAMAADSDDRSAARFLISSVLESARHPELVGAQHRGVASSREFIGSAVREAVERGELDASADQAAVVEMLVTVMWGMAFYAGYVGSHEQTESVVRQFQVLLTTQLRTVM